MSIIEFSNLADWPTTVALMLVLGSIIYYYLKNQINSLKANNELLRDIINNFDELQANIPLDTIKNILESRLEKLLQNKKLNQETIRKKENELNQVQSDIDAIEYLLTQVKINVKYPQLVDN